MQKHCIFKSTELLLQWSDGQKFVQSDSNVSMHVFQNFNFWWVRNVDKIWIKTYLIEGVGSFLCGGRISWLNAPIMLWSDYYRLGKNDFINLPLISVQTSHYLFRGNMVLPSFYICRMFETLVRCHATETLWYFCLG